MNILLGLVVYLCILLSSAHYQCLFCQDAVLPTDCNTVITCGSHQLCYVDAVMNIAGFTRYNLGCRDSQFCALGKREIETKQSVNKTRVATGSGRPEVVKIKKSAKTVGDLICSECCAGNLCSNNGCFTPGYPTQRGPICWNCHRQQSYSDCIKITMCQRGEVCILHKTNDTMMHTVRYETRCEHDTMCIDKIDTTHPIDSPVLVGRRQSSTNFADGTCNTHCCETDLCNNNCGIPSSTTAATTTTTTNPTTTTDPATTTSSSPPTAIMTTPLSPPTTIMTTPSPPSITATSPPPITATTTHSSPPTTIITTPSPTSTVPVTTPLMDPCFSNPCAGGVCAVYRDSYRCSCNHGYYGRNCDHVVPVVHTVQTTSLSTTTKISTVHPCDPNVCVHGMCRVTQASVECNCDPGYMGQICNIPVVCKPGFKSFGGKCYKVLEDKPRTYSDTEAACLAYGAHLAIVKTDEDKDAVINACLPGGFHGYWIGGNDRLTEGDFRWVDNSRVLDGVQYWGPTHGQSGNLHASHDCISLVMLRGFEWFDANCNETKFAICEYP